MHHSSRVPLLALTLTASLTTGCGPGGRPEAAFPASGASSYSAPSTPSTPFAPSEPGVPGREIVTAGLVVRPDLLCVPFAVRVIDPASDHAVAAAEAAVNDLGQKLRA